MRAKGWLAAAMLLPLTALSSCALIPQEEPIRTAPVIYTYEKLPYELTPVVRGELARTEKITCRYVPVRTDNLSFALGGEYVDRILVQPGDYVQEGQVIGLLQMGDLEDRIQSVRSAVEEQALRIAHLKEVQTIELRRSEVLDASLEEQERQERLRELEETHALEQQAQADAKHLLELELETLEQELAERQIRAPFSGTITYVRSYKEGAMSVFGETAIKVADSTMSLFRAETEHWDRFKPGDEYKITSGKVVNTVTVTDEASLGLETPEKVPGKKSYVYFVLNQSDTIYEDGDFASVEVVLDYREDTLHVPKDAVVSAGDMMIVYYQREDGMRSYKEVETGITAGRRIEILSGLTEGEYIIIS